MTRYHRIILLTLALIFVAVAGGFVLAQDDSAELTAGNNAFAFDLYQAIRASEDGNFMVSPYSISQALAMTYAGARHNTEAQMADTLHFTLPQDRLHAAFSALNGNFAARANEAVPNDLVGDRFQLNIANAIWGQDGESFQADFLAMLEQYYGAGLQLVDFIHAAEQARQEINAWVEDQTEGRIKDIIPPGVITDLTRLVLANAVYFNASWLYPFEESATHDDTFTLLDGSPVTVSMMEQTEWFNYMQGDGYQALNLPYFGGNMSMLVLLPDAGNFEAVENTLDADRLDAILAALQGYEVELSLPRFESEFFVNLSQIMAKMGMPDAFGGAADFSGMTGDTSLFISDVLHKSFIKVDESGTEAAAATVVIMTEGAFMGEPTIIEFRVDRPFIYAIVDQQTGTTLFVGRILDPTG